MKDLSQLKRVLQQIDGKGYKAYKEIAGGYRFDGGSVFIDYVQGDPFAAPSKLRVRIPQSRASLPRELCQPKTRRIALEDFLARQFEIAIKQVGNRRRGSGKSGRIEIDSGHQEVLERTAVKITEDWVEARVEAGLPAEGRRILGRQASEMLCEDLPEMGGEGLTWGSDIEHSAWNWVQSVENQESIRDQLESKGLVAFVANGSILPRESGVSDKPLPADKVIPFQSPESLQVAFEVPHPVEQPHGKSTTITGMGIPNGITLIVGGGYHGKSTLLRAIERGVYPHIPGDGRDFVVTNPEAVKIRAEDRRRIERVDVSPFISGLPNGQSTQPFSTEEASGSTSQAAAIMESLEAGVGVLLMDEDTSATNLMVRDARMQRLVASSHEPITPLVDRVHELYRSHGVSTILVMGGSGDYFSVADTVVMMRDYHTYDVTDEAKQIAQELPTTRASDAPASFEGVTPRKPVADSIDPERRSGKTKIDAQGIETLRFGEETVDLRCVEQLLDRSQTRAVGFALNLAGQRLIKDRATVSELLNYLDDLLEQEGLDALSPHNEVGKTDRQHPGNFARPRRHEIAAALNRLRSLAVHRL